MLYFGRMKDKNFNCPCECCKNGCFWFDRPVYDQRVMPSSEEIFFVIQPNNMHPLDSRFAQAYESYKKRLESDLKMGLFTSLMSYSKKILEEPAMSLIGLGAVSGGATASSGEGFDWKVILFLFLGAIGGFLVSIPFQYVTDRTKGKHLGFIGPGLTPKMKEMKKAYQVLQGFDPLCGLCHTLCKINSCTRTTLIPDFPVFTKKVGLDGVALDTEEEKAYNARKEALKEKKAAKENLKKNTIADKAAEAAENWGNRV